VLRKVIPAKETTNLENPAEIDPVPQELKLELSRKGEKFKKRQGTNHNNHETKVLNERRYGNGHMNVNNEVVMQQFLSSWGKGKVCGVHLGLVIGS
jgi:hypothetical protein